MAKENRCNYFPSAIQRCMDELLIGMAELYRQRHLPMHVHLAETFSQNVIGPRLYGTSLLRHRESNGVFGSNLKSLAHSIWIEKDDIDLIVQSAARRSIIPPATCDWGAV